MRKIFLRDLFERITILYRARFKETGVKFESDIIPPDLYIDADLELIEQVIINLIQNALGGNAGYPRILKLSIIAREK